MEHNKIIETIENSLHREIMDKFFIIDKFALGSVAKWRAEGSPFSEKINANGANDIVTEVDENIEAFAISTLKKAYPETDVFSEEKFENDFSITNKKRFFAVDPIDGTKELIKGNKEWSVSLCLIENGNPIVASIFMPDKNERFTAIKGKGVYINGKKIIVDSESFKKIGVSPRQIREDLFKNAILSSGFEPMKISAFTPKICSILKGEIDAAVYFPQNGQSATLWDYAAAVLLIREAGGHITSLCGNELPFKGEGVIHKKGWLAAKSLEIHEALISKLAI